MLQGLSNWIINNLNWIVPVLITAIFSVLNIRLAAVNQKLSENQLQLQNDSFCYQLYDRRMEVYTSIQNVIATIVQEGTVSIELLQEYLKCTRDVSFLFGDDITDKVERLYRVITELRTVSTKVNHNIEMQHTATNHNELCERECELLTQISDAGLHLKDDFYPYISFKNYHIDIGDTKK